MILITMHHFIFPLISTYSAPIYARYTRLFLILFMGVFYAENTPADIKKTLSLGYFYSEGKYYDSLKIKIQSIPFSIKLQGGNTRFKVASSFNAVNNPNNTETSLLENNQGIGNTYLSLNQIFKPPFLINFMDIGGKVKLPTASNTQSTSKYAFELNSNFYQRYGKSWLTAKLAHRWRMSPTLNNTFATSVGTSYKLTSSITPGVLADYRQAITVTGEPRKEFMFYIQQKTEHKMRYTYYLIHGFSKASPNWASGFQMGYQW